MEVSRRKITDGFVLEHPRGRLDVYELAPGVIFQDYYGVAVETYLQPVLDLAEERLAQGRRLTFYSNITRVHSSPTPYRRAWAHWFKEHDAQIDDIVVLAGSIVPVLAVKAANLITGGSIKVYYDAEQFQTHIEEVVTRVWETVDAEASDSHDSPAAEGTGKTDQAPSGPRPTPGPGGPPDPFASPLERNLGLDGLNAVLFGESFAEQRQASSSIGRFIVKHKLGAGGMGVVYACRDDVLGRDVAVKLLHAPGDKKSQRRILREAKALARLTHPNVVTVHEIGEADGAAFLVMELVHGTTVQRWLRDEPRTQQEILEVFVAAGRGLAAAHAKGLVHRDFKPENVMIDEAGRVLVMDFGLARGDAIDHPSASDVDGIPGPSPELTASGMLAGTPAYMAPETFGGGHTDARTDQFSFCAALWEGLYGQRPFTGSDLAALARAVLEQSPIVPRGSNVPRRLHEALVRGLMPDPTRRWESMDSLLDALSKPRPWFRRLFSRDT